MSKWFNVELTVLLMISLVAFAGFATTSTQSSEDFNGEYSDYEDVGESSNELTGDASLKKQWKKAKAKVSAEAKRVEEKFTSPVKAVKQLAKEITSTDCGTKFSNCFLVYLLLGNNVKLSLAKTDPKTNKPVADFSVELKGEGKRPENKVDIIVSQKLNLFDVDTYLQRFDERERRMNKDERECFNVFKNGVRTTMKKLESKAFDCRFDINQLLSLKSEKDVLNLLTGSIRNSLVAEKVSLSDPVDLLGYIRFKTKLGAPCKGPLLDQVSNTFSDLASVTKTSIDSLPCKKIVLSRKKQLLEGLMQQQNILDYLTAG